MNPGIVVAVVGVGVAGFGCGMAGEEAGTSRPKPFNTVHAHVRQSLCYINHRSRLQHLYCFRMGVGGWVAGAG